MHQVEGEANREATAFIASSLSFGSRKQFMAKIQTLLEWANGDMDAWIRSGAFEKNFSRDPAQCFYRFLDFGNMRSLLREYRRVMDEAGTLGNYVRMHSDTTGEAAVHSIERRFANSGCGTAVPCSKGSASKRLCMFLRWMVRSKSPVDLGLWANFIDRATLPIPLDTHVLQETEHLGIASKPRATMRFAMKLSNLLSEAFPGDPARGDFALFGLGVSHI